MRMCNASSLYTAPDLDINKDHVCLYLRFYEKCKSQLARARFDTTFSGILLMIMVWGYSGGLH